MARIDPHLVISHKFPEATYQYSERDAALYALGIGACARDALDGDELRFVYHENGQQLVKGFDLVFVARLGWFTVDEGMCLDFRIEYRPDRGSLKVC
ncbi:Enoyl-CoA hydratase 2, peroxisomal-like protein [Drosera capensis]